MNTDSWLIPKLRPFVPRGGLGYCALRSTYALGWVTHHLTAMRAEPLWRRPFGLYACIVEWG